LLAPLAIYTLSLHDALPIWIRCRRFRTRRPRWPFLSMAVGVPPPCVSVALRPALSTDLATSSPDCEENSTCVIWSIPGSFLSTRSEEHTSELQSLTNLVCRL